MSTVPLDVLLWVLLAAAILGTAYVMARRRQRGYDPAPVADPVGGPANAVPPDADLDVLLEYDEASEELVLTLDAPGSAADVRVWLGEDTTGEPALSIDVLRRGESVRLPHHVEPSRIRTEEGDPHERYFHQHLELHARTPEDAEERNWWERVWLR